MWKHGTQKQQNQLIYFRSKSEKTCNFALLRDIFTSLVSPLPADVFDTSSAALTKTAAKFLFIFESKFSWILFDKKLWPNCYFWHVECKYGNTSSKLSGRHWQTLSFFWSFRVFLPKLFKIQKSRQNFFRSIFKDWWLFLNSLKPLSLKLFPWTLSLQMESPKMNGFCSKRTKIRLY